MIERKIDDDKFEPRALWTVTVKASCPKCEGLLTIKKGPDSPFTLQCASCGYACELNKSPDDVADDVLTHVKGNRQMNTDRIRAQAEIETEVQLEKDRDSQ